MYVKDEYNSKYVKVNMGTVRIRPPNLLVFANLPNNGLRDPIAPAFGESISPYDGRILVSKSSYLTSLGTKNTFKKCIK